MEDYLKYKSYTVHQNLSKGKGVEIINRLENIQGIEKIDFSGQTVSFIFNPYVIDEKEIMEKLISLGFTVKIPGERSFKERIADWANTNKQIFGDKGPNCCNLNQKNI